jgi:structure-specific recognition protein 1
MMKIVKKVSPSVLSHFIMLNVNLADEDFEASDTDEGSPSDTDSENDEVVSDASGDADIANAGKKAVKGPKKKKKSEVADGEADGAEGSSSKKKAKKKSNAADKDGDAEMKETSPKPKAPPKPKAKAKPAEKSPTEDGPAKKKQKKDA